MTPGDLVLPKPDGVIVLWPEFEVNNDPENELNVPRVYLLGNRDVILDGLALVVAVLEWPEIDNSRIIMLMFGNHIGYNREMFLRLVE